MLGLMWSTHAAWTPPDQRHVPNLRTIPLSGTEHGQQQALGVLVAEEWGTNSIYSLEDHRSISVSGNNRLFLAAPDAAGAADFGMRTWADVTFRKLRLLDKELSFTIDLSHVNCGCNAAVYLVDMNEVPSSIISSGYCERVRRGSNAHVSKKARYYGGVPPCEGYAKGFPPTRARMPVRSMLAAYRAMTIPTLSHMAASN